MVIPNRADIVKKLERDVTASIQRAVDSVAEALNKTTTLPLHWSVKLLDPQIRTAVKDRLSAAGWKVEINVGHQLDNDPEFVIS